MSQTDNGKIIKNCMISTFDAEKSNKFLIVSDNTNPKNKDRIIRGNQKVILPRLDDTNFFYNKI